MYRVSPDSALFPHQIPGADCFDTPHTSSEGKVFQICSALKDSVLHLLLEVWVLAIGHMAIFIIASGIQVAWQWCQNHYGVVAEGLQVSSYL
jgi:hypothetical protein